MNNSRGSAPHNIPVLRDVVMPGQRAARGQRSPDERRASAPWQPEPGDQPEDELDDELEPDPIDTLLDDPEPEPEPVGSAAQAGDSAVYDSILGTPLEHLDIEGAIDRVLDRHAQTLREELRAEFERLVREARGADY